MKTFHVWTFSNVKGLRKIEAENAELAFAIVDAEMKESLARLMRTTELHPDILQISGHAGASEVAEEIS